MVEQLNQIPASLEPIGTFGSKDLPIQMTGVWYKFLLSVSRAVGGIVGGVLGFSLDGAVTAVGASQATAQQLSTEWAVINAGAVNAGVIINHTGAGTMTWVFNTSGTAKDIYPPLGSRIDALAVNAPYSLAPNKAQIFSQISVVQYLSMQLG